MSSASSQGRPVLAGVDLFRGIEDRELARLERLGRRRQYQAGDNVVQQGQGGIALFVVMSGRVQVTRRDGEGNEQVLRTIGPGGSFGEMALFSNRPRSATITAVEPTECLVLHRLDFLEELRRDPDIAIRLLDTLSQRLIDAERRP